MVFQEFSLIPQMSVGQNILLTREPRGRLGLIDDRRAGAPGHRRARPSRRRHRPGPVGGGAARGARQLVEIAKAISRDASILILDEPTASLAAAESRTLMTAVRRLIAEGISVVYISHHLNEIMAICDQVTVLRDGEVTLSAPTAGTSLSAIIESMLGRSLESALSYHEHEVDRTGVPLLRVAGLTNARLRDISFDLFRGEIVGVAGLLGSGRSELMRAVFGIDRLEAGSVEVDGHPVRLRGPRDALDAGIALVPEDRCPGRPGPRALGRAECPHGGMAPVRPQWIRR